jgi:hypothetical protein
MNYLSPSTGRMNGRLNGYGKFKAIKLRLKVFEVDPTSL